MLRKFCEGARCEPAPDGIDSARGSGWYEEYCHFQRQHFVPGEIKPAPVTGVVNCYLGLAYSLYLIKHNVELQIRAGFKLARR